MHSMTHWKVSRVKDTLLRSLLASALTVCVKPYVRERTAAMLHAAIFFVPKGQAVREAKKIAKRIERQQPGEHKTAEWEKVSSTSCCKLVL